MKSKWILLTSLFIGAILFAACSDDDSSKTLLGNDCIKRSISPNIVGEYIEFAYAMALPPSAGKLESASVTATIAGASETYLDQKSYHTNSSGQDIGVVVAEKSQLQGNSCTTSFIVDTCASTLRYFYQIPEEARGKEVSFTFSVKASNGEQQQYEMGAYKISKMDMIKNLVLTHGDSSCISLTSLKVYSQVEIAANASLASEIDVVFGFSDKATFGHALYSPTASKEYLDKTIIPSGAVSDSKLVKVWALRDQQLSDLQWAVFIDDLDFEKLSFQNSNNYYLGLKAENGVWVETGDKKYRAYIYINSIADGRMTVSIKRYLL
jgi:hypothetical protein